MGREILHAVEIEADPEKLTQAISTMEGVAGFWTSRNDLRPEVGSTASIGFPAAPVDLSVRVEAVEPGKRVTWASLGPWPYWEGTIIDWELEAGDAGGTKVMFRHTGWAEGYPERDYASVNFVWGQVLGRLKAHVETGTPQPLFG
jgi:uncharacterized protein YndB with AHSA1/START domain